MRLNHGQNALTDYTPRTLEAVSLSYRLIQGAVRDRCFRSDDMTNKLEQHRVILGLVEALRIDY
tara:strand:- start:43 stop:234 length:192 start_codon:yes stop_codon:yes gene_type:complete